MTTQNSLLGAPISQTVKQIKSKNIKAVDLVKEVYTNIEKRNKTLNAYRSVLDRQIALKKAEIIDQKANLGQALGKLAGIVVGLKDNIVTKEDELGTFCSSKILKDYQSPFNATVVDKLLAEDAIIIGKANMDEFAMGSSSENCAYGTVKNPWNIETIPGGSSGGSAVAMSAGMANFTLGSDTGGSIRQPASMCSVTGFKPSYGAVSRYGLVAYGSSLDQIGPLTKSAEDLGYVYNVIAGHDAKDQTSSDVALKPSSITEIKGTKFCYLKEALALKAADSQVIDSFNKMVQFLKDQGAKVTEVSLASLKFVVPTYYIIAFAEATSNLSRFDGVRYGQRRGNKENLENLYLKSRSQGFGEEVKRRIMLGNFVLSSGYYDQFYAKATRARTKLEFDVSKIFSQNDFIISPTAPTPAFKIGEKIEDPLAMYLEDVYTVLPNLIKTPAISIPGGFSSDNLPIGFQIIANRFDDNNLISISQAIQAKTDFHQKQPAL